MKQARYIFNYPFIIWQATSRAIMTTMISLWTTQVLLTHGTLLLICVVSYFPTTTTRRNYHHSSTEHTLEMIVSAHPLATAAGVNILRAGGTAADAAVAIQSVLGLVEPQSSGFGGGGFAVYFDAASETTTTFDGRETAPASASEDRFTGLDFISAWQSGLSVGVPGIPRLLETLHDRFGGLEWNEDLFADARTLATDGFEITGRLADVVNLLLNFTGFDCENRLFFRDEAAFDYFVDGDLCRAKPAGTIQTNLDYAAILDILANGGSKAFYEGSNAEAIVNAIINDVSIPGDMTLADLSSYEVIERDPICHTYRKDSKLVCGMGPPSSGALAVGQMLGILDTFQDMFASDVFDATALHPTHVHTVHLFTQANRLAFADRELYVADPDFVDVPSQGMLDKNYLHSRASSIDLHHDMGIVQPGLPPGIDSNTGVDNKPKTSGTSHFSIIDRCGNALSMSTSIEAPFGNGVMVNGYLLNNELTDFSFASKDSDGRPIANRVQGKKRPRSNMSPTVVFDRHGVPQLVTGSPGGSDIIEYTAKTIFLVYGFGLEPQEATDVPHYNNNNAQSTLVEAVTDAVNDEYDIDGLIDDLEERNHTVNSRPMISGLATIYRSHDDGGVVLLGGADRRRDLTVGGTDRSKDDNSERCSKV